MAINKTLNALCKRIVTRLREEGYREPGYTVSVTPESNSEVRLHVAFNVFLSSKEEGDFNREIKQIINIAAAKLDPTRIVDNSSFGGHSTFLIKRGKKIDADALLSDIDVTFHLPVNRYK